MLSLNEDDLALVGFKKYPFHEPVGIYITAGLQLVTEADYRGTKNGRERYLFDRHFLLLTLKIEDCIYALSRDSGTLT